MWLKTFIYFISFIAIIMILSCKKDNDIYVKATVINELSGKPIPKTKLLLEEIYYPLFCIDHTCDRSAWEKEFETNSDGVIFFEFTANKKQNRYSYTLSLIEEKGKILYGQSFASYKNSAVMNMMKRMGEEEKNQEYTFIITPMCYIKFIYNTNSTNVNDHLTVYSVDKDETKKLSSNIRFDYDTTYNNHKLVPCADPVILKCEATKNNITSTFYDTVYAKPFEKLEHTINW